MVNHATAVGLSGCWGRVSITQIRRKCLKWNYYCTWNFFRTSVAGSSCFELGLTVNQNQKRDYIRKQLQKDTSSIYEKTTCFLQLAVKLWHWTACKGLYLQEKIGIYQALSLSLSSTGRERARGEVGGSWTLIRSNHPTAIFGQHVPYPARLREFHAIFDHTIFGHIYM